MESHRLACKAEVWATMPAEAVGGYIGISTYVPGFWSWKGLSSTVRVLMMAVCILQAVTGAIEAVVVSKEYC